MYTAGNAWSGSSHYSLPRIPRDMNLHISRIVSTFLPAACRVNINRRSKSTDECERRTPRVRNSVLTDLAPLFPPNRRIIAFEDLVDDLFSVRSSYFAPRSHTVSCKVCINIEDYSALYTNIYIWIHVDEINAFELFLFKNYCFIRKKNNNTNSKRFFVEK